MEQATGSTGLVAPGRWHRAAWPSSGSVLLAEAAAAAAGLGTAALGGPHWAAATAALTVGAGALVRVRGTSGAEYAADRLRVRATAGALVEAAPYPGGGEIGVRRAERRLTAFVRLAPPAPQLVPMLRREDPAIPLRLLADLLRHADTPLARIDLLLAGGRVPGEPPAPRMRYQQLLGPLHRWAGSDVLVAVTIDPGDCSAACARRGGGPSGELRVAALAAQRTVDVLRAQGITAVPLRPAEAAGVDPEAPAGSVPCDPEALAQGDLGPLFSVDAPGRAAISVRAGRSGGVRVGAWRSADGATEAGRRGDHEATGPQDALGAVHVPLGGCGQILGSDATGGPVAARLHGRGVRTVWAAVADDPARQLVERAVATGARVLIVTGRPAMWQPLVNWVGSPRHLWISGWRYPQQLAELGPADYTVTVLDGTAAGLTPGAVEPSGTVWRIEQAGISPVTEADVVLSQPLPGMLTVRTDGGAATLRLVA
ncbi:type VII secretion protein EccE [Tsukamurella sp. DT100]|uniref:type VII secretion protein EccE n=1 Tax=Tsukamurella sp. DT100 TaxID=3393415 RepID=UPI003CF20CFE